MAGPQAAGLQRGLWEYLWPAILFYFYPGSLWLLVGFLLFVLLTSPVLGLAGKMKLIESLFSTFQEREI